MLHIAICDDEKEFVAYMTGLLKQYAAETGEEIKVTAYYDGIELIEKYDTTIDLIFLDIQMRLVDGLRAAERIRQMDENVSLIFLTTLTQYGLHYKTLSYSGASRSCCSTFTQRKKRTSQHAFIRSRHKI